jgi:uncharacterized protein (DUF433 family)
VNIPPELQNVLLSDPEVSGGTICFRGTRFPLTTFLAYIAGGSSLDEFLSGYSSVTRDQAMAVLEWQGATALQSIGLEEAA